MASMGDMGAGSGMLVVETIAKIRRAYFAQKKPIKAICREFRLSRKVVRKVIRSEATEFHYERGRQPPPRMPAGLRRRRCRRFDNLLIPSRHPGRVDGALHAVWASGKPRRLLHQPSRVRPEEQIAEGATQEIGDPPLRQMMRPIVDHVATLAQALEIAQAVIARVMIEMRCGQDDAGLPYLCRFHEIGPASRPAAAVAPGVTCGVEPATVW
jgi:hypothetical protein